MMPAESMHYVQRPQAYPKGYDAADYEERPKRRTRLNFLGVLVLVFLPWAMFIALFSLSCFWRYHNPDAYIGGYLLAFAVICLCGHLDVVGRIKKSKQEASRVEQALRRGLDPGEDPFEPRFSLWMVGFVCMLVCYLLAFFGGNINFNYNLSPWFDMTFMQTYNPVDVDTATGQQHMDAGQMFFKNTAKVDTTKMKAFKSDSWYCVAPVTSDSKAPGSTFDFWAAGVNCCDGGQWNCGMWNNPKAHAGLRINKKKNDMGYFRLAVKQAQISFGIKVDNPIFLVWLQNPAVEIQQYTNDAVKVYTTMVVVVFIVNIIVLVAMVFLMYARCRPAYTKEDTHGRLYADTYGQ